MTSPTQLRTGSFSSSRRKLSISELAGNKATLHSDESCRASLTILRAPSAKEAASPPLLSPRNAFSNPLFLHKSPQGPSLLLPSLPSPAKDVDVNMPRTPTDFYTRDQVLEAVGASQLGDTSPSMAISSPSDDSFGSPQLCPDDILLPFRHRSTEVREVLFKTINKPLLDLLQTRKDLWVKLDKILQIDRDIMNDEAWVGELKSGIKPTLGEAVWERVRRCLGIDSEDSYKAAEQDTQTYVTIESVFEGDSFIESDKALSDIRRASTPNSNTSPLPFVIDDLSDSPRHYRTGSSSSVKGLNVPMDSISEFPEAREPPKKLDSALLAEQDRQFASTSRSRSRKRMSMASLTGSFISEEPEEDNGEEDPGRLTRRSSNRSIESTAESPHRRLRGLKFTPVSPTPPARDLSSSIDTLPPGDSAILDDDDEPFKPHHGIKYSFGNNQRGGPVKVF